MRSYHRTNTSYNSDPSLPSDRSITNILLPFGYGFYSRYPRFVYFQDKLIIYIESFLNFSGYYLITLNEFMRVLKGQGLSTIEKGLNEYPQVILTSIISQCHNLRCDVCNRYILCETVYFWNEICMCVHCKQ